MNSLFDPLKIRGLEFANRIWVSPMCQYSCLDGIIGPWHKQHLGALVAGRPGLLMMEATGVSPEARISIGCTGIWNSRQVASYREVVEFSHSQGVPIGIQLVHSGRKGSTMPTWSDYEVARVEDGSWQTVAPSPIPLNGFPTPRVLSTSEIVGIIEDFASAAKRAVSAGFDLIELHAAYGYLIHQFLSPISNRRVDEYGGDFLGRTRLLCEIVQNVRKEIPSEMPLLVRIPAQDWVEGGWSLQESIELVTLLKNFGVDLVDIVSGGIVEGAWGESFEGFQVPFSAAIRTATGLKTAAGGSISDPKYADEVIRNGYADALMIGAEMLRNPHWPLIAAETLGVLTPWPNQYRRARK